MSSQYLTVEEFTKLCIMPMSGIDELETSYVDWLDSTLKSYSGLIDARLAKRYATPFQSPYPEQVKQWLVRLVNIRAQLKRGITPSDQQTQLLVDDAALVLTELQEAADAQNGLWDLPLRADTDTSGITKPKILFRSDATPYDWMRTQARRAYGNR